MNENHQHPQRKGGIYIVSALVLCAIAAAVYYGYLRPRQEKRMAEQRRTYSAEPAKSTASPEKSAPATETHRAAPGPSVETEESTTELNDAGAEPVTSQEDVSEAQEDALSEAERVEAARIKKQELLTQGAAGEGATDKLFAESEALLRETEEALDLAILALIAHLNTLSPGEQSVFLAELRTSLNEQVPPHLKEIREVSPDFAEQIWEKYLEKFAEHGYAPPE